MKPFILLLLWLPALSLANSSTCFGTTADGRLKNGVKMPAKGSNYLGYSTIARLAGRTFVHSEVRDIIVSAYKTLESEQPGKVFKYAETGFKEGGAFKPHKTHQNGLSVDFMTPVLNKNNQSVHLPTHPFNRFGYDIEFNENGRFKQTRIDYDAIAAHITALHKEALSRGFNLWRVIFDPQLQPHLFNTPYAIRHTPTTCVNIFNFQRNGPG